MAKKSKSWTKEEKGLVPPVVTERFDSFDSWANFMSILGEQTGRSKVDGFVYDYKPLNQVELDQFFENNAIAGKIAKKPADDMTRQGIDITHKRSKDIYKFYDKYNLLGLLNTALVYNNVYGGSAIIFDFDDGLAEAGWSEELNIKNVKGIKEIHVVDRFFLNPVENNNILKEPTHYNLSYGTTQIKIHSSRMILFKGLDVGLRNRQRNNSFGQSRIQRIKDALKNYGVGHDALPEIVVTFIQNIFKFKDMTKMINNNQGSKLYKRASYLQASRNYLGALLLDSEDDFISKTINVSGIKDLITMIERRLCAEAEIAHTRLLEEGTTGGLSNNGDNSEESKQWYDWVKTEQVKVLTNPIEYCHRVIEQLLGLKSNSILWEFAPLKQQTEKEIIDNRNKQADTDSKYHTLVKQGDSFAKMLIQKRFGQGYYSSETNLTEEEINAIFKSTQDQTKPEPQPQPEVTK